MSPYLLQLTATVAAQAVILHFLLRGSGLFWVAAALMVAMSLLAPRRRRGLPRVRRPDPGFLRSSLAALIAGGAVPVWVLLSVDRLTGAEFLLSVALGWTLFAWGRALVRDRESVQAAHDRVGVLFAALVISYAGAKVDPYGELPVFWIRFLSYGGVLLAAGLWFLAKGSEGWRRPSVDRLHAAKRRAQLVVPLLVVAGALLSAGLSLGTDATSLAALKLRYQVWHRGDSASLDDDPVVRRPAGPGETRRDFTGRRLPQRADITLANRLRVMIQTESRSDYEALIREPIYVRTLTFANFDDDGSLSPLRRATWRTDEEDGLIDGWTHVSDREPTPSAEEDRFLPHRVFVGADEMRALPALAGVSAFELREVYAFADDWFQIVAPERGGDDAGANVAEPREDADESVGSASSGLADEADKFVYQARSRPLRVEELGSAPITSGDASEVYLTLPFTPMTARLREAAQDILGEELDAPLTRQLELLRQFLRNQCRYSLSYDNPEDLPVVENFLFSERQGHCELFAASTVMLLRCLGVPSRVAYGFCGGTARPADRVVGFRDRDFHAWAEIYLEGIGWVIYETTPPGSGAVSPARAGLQQPENRLPPLGGYRAVAPQAALLEGEGGWVPDWLLGAVHWVREHIQWVALLAATILILAWIGRILLPRGNRDEEIEVVVDVPKIGGRRGYLDAFFQLWEREGQVKGAGETLHEFIQRLQRRGFCQQQFDEMRDYHYGVTFGGQSRSLALEREFRRHARRFRRSLDS